MQGSGCVHKLTCQLVQACFVSVCVNVWQYLKVANTVNEVLHDTHATVRLTIAMLWEKRRGYTCLSPAMPQLW